MGVEVVTFGCRLNTLESEVMGRLARESGLEDAVIFNTCAVTSEATRQARQSIRRIKRERPDARIVVTGCAAQTEAKTFAGMAEVDRVIGNDEKMRASGWTATRQALTEPADSTQNAEAKLALSDIMTVRDQGLHQIDRMAGRTRAFVQVQNGCDHRCTFCIIPYGRGNSRSVPIAEVVAQVRTLVVTGHREVVLTGVDLTSYGEHLPSEPRLGALVKAILRAVPDLERLRLSSIDSVEADDDLRDAIASEPRLMPHLHLSLQAGDDLILKRMKRRHARADAIQFARDIRALRPDIVFGADIIVGFPTETEEMFARSLDIVGECGLTHLHVFPFSPRPGTPAERMPQVAREVVKDRARRLRERGEAALESHLTGLVGQTFKVLIETETMGRTEQFTPVRFDRAVTPGEIVEATITGHNSREALGIQGI